MDSCASASYRSFPTLVVSLYLLYTLNNLGFPGFMFCGGGGFPGDELQLLGGALAPLTVSLYLMHTQPNKITLVFPDLCSAEAAGFPELSFSFLAELLPELELEAVLLLIRFPGEPTC